MTVASRESRFLLHAIWVGSIALALALVLFIIPGAAAQANPPGHVVMHVNASHNFESNGQMIGALAWKLSPDDTDQTSGDFAYWIWGTCSNPATFTNLTPIAAGAPMKASGRAGWVTHDGDFTCTFPSGEAAVNLTVKTSDGTAGGDSAFSCVLTIQNFRPNYHAECGNDPIDNPAGMGVVVTTAATSTTSEGGEIVAGTSGIANVTFLRSPDDSADDFNHSVVFGLGSVENGALKFPLSGVNTTATFVNGTGTLEHQTGAGTIHFYGAFAIDPLTYRHSNFSCVVNINPEVAFDSMGCDALKSFSAGVAAPTADYPLVDIPDGASAFGISQTSFALFLAAVTLLAGIVGGSKIAGKPGGFIGGGVTFGFVIVLGLIPLWFVVVVFMGLVVFTVMRMKNGGGA